MLKLIFSYKLKYPIDGDNEEVYSLVSVCALQYGRPEWLQTRGKGADRIHNLFSLNGAIWVFKVLARCLLK